MPRTWRNRHRRDRRQGALANHPAHTGPSGRRRRRSRRYCAVPPSAPPICQRSGSERGKADRFTADQRLAFRPGASSCFGAACTSPSPPRPASLRWRRLHPSPPSIPHARAQFAPEPSGCGETGSCLHDRAGKAGDGQGKGCHRSPQPPCDERANRVGERKRQASSRARCATGAGRWWGRHRALRNPEPSSWHRTGAAVRNPSSS